MKVCFWISATLICSALSMAGRAVASPLLRYEVAAGCPDRPQFVAAVGARGGELGAEGDEGGRTLAISVVRTREGFSGWLQVSDARGASRRREVHAVGCGEAIDALAVVAAITLRGQPEAEPSMAAPPPDLTPAPASPDAAPAAAPGAVLGTRAPLEATAPSIGASYAVTLSGGIELGLVPSLAVPVLDLSISRGTFIRTADGRSRLVGPLLRFGGALMANVKRRAGGETTDVGGQQLSVAACLAPTYDPQGLVVLTCANLTAGLIGMRHTGIGGVKSAAKTSGFGAIGLEVDGLYNLVGHLQLVVRLGAGALTDRITAERDDGSPIFRSSRFVGTASFGVGGHF
jgi:hypothetical protein